MNQTQKNSIPVSGAIRKRAAPILLYLALVSIFIFSGFSPSDIKRDVYFKNTEYELNIYRITGHEPGPTMLIIGGIHNEPGGYITADSFVDISLKKGNLIVVPRANFQTIIDDKRGVLGDMNRLFYLKEPRFEDDHSMKIVNILKELIAESDMMLNLHDGWGFYREDYIDEMHNPERLGQSIVADTDVYVVPGTGTTIRLQEIVEKICTIVNSEISDEEHFFHFNNHNTFSDTTPHPEQRRSATFYALSTHNIPSFGIETSKNISNLTLKVRYQTIIVNTFLEEFGIVRDVIRNPLLDPRLQFLALSINGNPPQLFLNRETVRIRPGDTVNIMHIEANYERGLYADIVNYGNTNDLGKPVALYSSTSILVKKDSFPCGEISVEVSDEVPAHPAASDGHNMDTAVESFIVEVNGFPRYIPAAGVLSVMKGDTICFVDTSPSLDVFPETRINLFGYWQKTGRRNTGNDLNIPVNTGTDLNPKYSVRERGTEYEVRLERGDEILERMRVRLVNPELEHFILRFDNGNMGFLKNDQTYTFGNEQSFEIIEVKTNIPNNYDVQVNVKGFVGNAGGSDTNMPVHVTTELLPEYSLDKQGRLYAIEATFHGKLIGKAYVQLNGNFQNNR